VQEILFHTESIVVDICGQGEPLCVSVVLHGWRLFSPCFVGQILDWGLRDINKQTNGSGNGASLFIGAGLGEPRVDIEESLSTLRWQVTP